MTDVSTVFPGVEPKQDTTGNELLKANSDKQAFNDAVAAEVAKQMAKSQRVDTSEYREYDGPKSIARDTATGDHYGGLISQELADACKDSGDGHVRAVQRSIVKNRLGEKVNVWFPAPEHDGISPIPGEYRKVYLEEQEDKDKPKRDAIDTTGREVKPVTVGAF